MVVVIKVKSLAGLKSHLALQKLLIEQEMVRQAANGNKEAAGGCVILLNELEDIVADLDTADILEDYEIKKSKDDDFTN